MPPPPRRVLITGVSGQDGGYLAELLLSRGDNVFGLLRPGEPATSTMPEAIATLTGSLEDAGSLRVALQAARPDDVYNLAAATNVGESFRDPLGTADITAMGVLRLLEAIRAVDPSIRMLQASSSEIFAGATVSPQSEATPLAPRSPYGVAKAFAHEMVRTYRESHGLFACNAILYNHESPRRGLRFVTRKITDGAARISLGLETELRLGNLEVARDWGYAPDYVRAMHLMLGQDTPDDYIIATGEVHTLQEFLELAFTAVDLDWRDHVVSDPGLLRPSEPLEMRGDAGLARRRLGWTTSVDFAELVRRMVAADRARLSAATPGPAGR